MSRLSSKSRIQALHCGNTPLCIAGWVGEVTRAVTCCDIHIDGTAFGVQTRTRLSKPAMVPWYLRSVPMDGLAQSLAQRAQLQYIDLPQVCIVKSITRFSVTHPWFCDQNKKIRCLRGNAHINRSPASFTLSSSHKVAIAVKQ